MLRLSTPDLLDPALRFGRFPLDIADRELQIEAQLSECLVIVGEVCHSLQPLIQMFKIIVLIRKEDSAVFEKMKSIGVVERLACPSPEGSGSDVATVVLIDDFDQPVEVRAVIAQCVLRRVSSALSSP